MLSTSSVSGHDIRPGRCRCHFRFIVFVTRIHGLYKAETLGLLMTPAMLCFNKTPRETCLECLRRVNTFTEHQRVQPIKHSCTPMLWELPYRRYSCAALTDAHCTQTEQCSTGKVFVVIRSNPWGALSYSWLTVLRLFTYNCNVLQSITHSTL